MESGKLARVSIGKMHYLLIGWVLIEYNQRLILSALAMTACKKGNHGVYPAIEATAGQRSSVCFAHLWSMSWFRSGLPRDAQAARMEPFCAMV
jgi:hypothetical protein